MGSVDMTRFIIPKAIQDAEDVSDGPTLTTQDDVPAEGNTECVVIATVMTQGMHSKFKHYSQPTERTLAST